MAKILYESINKRRMIVVGVSRDWYTLTPWEHKGEIMPYIGRRKNISESKNIEFNYTYLGPFSVVIAKWIGNNGN